MTSYEMKLQEAKRRRARALYESFQEPKVLCQAQEPTTGFRCDRQPHSGLLHRNMVLGASWTSPSLDDLLATPESEQ